jgi:hypothetical protein
MHKVQYHDHDSSATMQVRKEIHSSSKGTHEASKFTEKRFILASPEFFNPAYEP